MQYIIIANTGYIYYIDLIYWQYITRTNNIYINTLDYSISKYLSIYYNKLKKQYTMAWGSSQRKCKYSGGQTNEHKEQITSVLA